MDKEQKNIRILGGRKFILSVLTLLSSSFLVYTNKIDPGVYSAVIIATIGAYITGNVVQNIRQV